MSAYWAIQYTLPEARRTGAPWDHDWKTIRVPSGDQPPNEPEGLTRWRFPPSASTTKGAGGGGAGVNPLISGPLMSKGTSWVKPICVPSGDQTGPRSWKSPAASRIVVDASSSTWPVERSIV